MCALLLFGYSFPPFLSPHHPSYLSLETNQERTKVRLQALLAPFQPILFAGLSYLNALHPPHALKRPKSTMTRPILSTHCALSFCRRSLVESHTSRGLSRIQHQFTVQIWPFKHTYVASRDTIAPTTSNGQKVRPIFVPMAPNKTRKRMRRRMHNHVSFVAIAGIWNGVFAQRRIL